MSLDIHNFFLTDLKNDKEAYYLFKSILVNFSNQNCCVGVILDTLNLFLQYPKKYCPVTILLYEKLGRVVTIENNKINIMLKRDVHQP